MPDSSPPGVPLDASVRELADGFEIDYKTLLIDLGTATVSGLIGFSTANPAAFGSALKDLVHAYSAFGARRDVYDQVGDDPGKLAFLLLHQSILAAVTDLVGDHDARFRAAYQDAEVLPTEDEMADRLRETLDVTLTETDVRISEDFFTRPTTLPILKPLQDDLAAWFEAMGVPPGEAHSIARRLPAYFRSALIDEWRARGEYQRLEQAVRIPFSHAEHRAWAWDAYRAHLQKAVDEPVFGEAVSLRQVYVEPRTYVRVPADDDRPGPDGRRSAPTAAMDDTERTGTRRVSWLRASVKDWLSATDPSDAMRIIKGDPGTGKSSFTKMLAAGLAEEGDRFVLFMPLHLLDATKQLQDAIRDVVSVPDHPLNGVDPFEERPLLLILDGLDELSMQGKAGGELAKEFVNEIDRFLRRFNQSEVTVRVLLSGRRIAADAAASVLRDPTKVFTLIPFVPEGNAASYEDPDHLAFDDENSPIDQRDDWWRQYGEETGAGYDGMPDRLREGRLDAITTQPLLNYLVALAYEDDDSQFGEDASLNSLYEQLLDGVYRRDYDFGPHPGTEVVAGKTRELQKEGFLRVLEEIALDAWHSNSRTTTVASIRERCEHENLTGRFEVVKSRLETGISQLLAAFYFRKTGQTQQGDPTFEFTHKTFAEYLTARRLARTVGEIHEERLRHEEKGGRYGLSLVDGLVAWIEICGPTAMDEDVFEFFDGEIRWRHETDDCAEAWQDTFAAFLRHTVRHDLPMHELTSRLDYTTEKGWARNAEESLLAVVHACRRARLASVPEGDRTPGLHAIEVFEDVSSMTAGDWIRRLQAPFRENHSSLYRRFLNSIVWKRAVLPAITILSGNLQGADLQYADLRDANLRAANLRGANLRAANLRGANLRDADLRYADLRGADLRYADLRDADLRDADLRDADLRDVDLRGANLQDALVHGAWISDTTRMDDDTRAYLETQRARSWS